MAIPRLKRSAIPTPATGFHVGQLPRNVTCMPWLRSLPPAFNTDRDGACQLDFLPVPVRVAVPDHPSYQYRLPLGGRASDLGTIEST